MKQLNAAHDYIRSYLSFKDQADTYTESTASVYDEEITVTCPSCYTKNRIRAFDQIEIIIRCGSCGFVLYGDEYASSGEYSGERILCRDGECIGIIGSNGRCTTCGKTFEEGKRADEHKTEREEQARRQYSKEARRQRNRKIFFWSGLIACLILLISVLSNLPDPDNTSTRRTTRGRTKRPPASLVPAPKSSPRNTPDYDRYFTKEFFIRSGLEKDSILLLQRNLLTLDYDIGIADGIIGKKTLAALKQFTNDFDLKPYGNFAKKVLISTTYHALITRSHPDWPTIVRNGELRAWISKQPPQFSREIEKVMESENPRKVIKLLNLYKFDKEKPPQLPLPRNGIVKKHFTEGVAPLRIVTRHANQHHYVKLVRLLDKKDIVKVFIRGGTTSEIEVPLGRYEMKYAVGETWYGEKFLFGPYTSYGKADAILEFEQRGYNVVGHTVELFLQPHGNLRIQDISAFNF